MLYAISEKLAYLLTKHERDAELQQVCAYGIDAALYTLVSTAGLLAIGCLFHMPYETIWMVAIYYLHQTEGGGYHASTHWKCFISMAIGLVCLLLLLYIFKAKPAISVILTLIACINLFVFPLHLHPNKAYLQKKAYELKCRSRITTGLSLIAFGLSVACFPDLSMATALALAAAAVSRNIGLLQKKIKV